MVGGQRAPLGAQPGCPVGTHRVNDAPQDGVRVLTCSYRQPQHPPTPRT